ncbi:glycosyltransferase family 25 protein [Olivibacter domesticus]|uniref:Glycosyl transferase, family 25 n=1 Tax=Olivibacter domesticus TaxID=407022 RepID=A0A1H7JQ38_OLID1|nr:glycosyl transferase [Olivibacter domesticus]SEK76761.1 glycosyl transferase, family 25 [Olivibacter domesticus]
MFDTFIINLKSRDDRKDHILKEFQDKNIFNLTVIEAVKHSIGALGLWITVKGIVLQALNQELEMIIICEDDHKFTDMYNEACFLSAVEKAKNIDADLLLGGVSWFEDIVQVDEGIFWISRFNGLQFTVIFKKFYEKILDIDFDIYDNADIKLSLFTEQAFVIHPFISVQKEFGYSDITRKNGEQGWVNMLFDVSDKKIKQLGDVSSFYKNM